MIDAFTKILEKISSYQLFNYLFPGIIFHFGVNKIMSYRLSTDDILFKLAICYISGMLLSRIGSTIIEPIYKKLCIVVYSSYSNFLKARTTDEKLDMMVSENNTYRTLISTFICLLILFLIDQIDWLHGKYTHPIAIVIYLLLLIFLFSCSFVKQTTFIRRNVHHALNINDNDEIESLKKEQKKIKISKQII